MTESTVSLPNPAPTPTPSPPWDSNNRLPAPTKSSLFVPFVWLRASTLQQLLTLLQASPLSKRERGQLRWYRALCILRLIGRAAGFLMLLALSILFASLATALGAHIWMEALVNTATAMARFIGVAVFVWLYFDCLVWFQAPLTSFAFRIAQFNRETFASAEGLSRADVIKALGLSGALARVMFRTLTKKIVNAGIRPDLAEYVLSVSSKLLIRNPDGGPDSLRHDAHLFASYSRYTRDVAGLLIIQRVDLIDQVTAKYSSLRTTDTSEEMRKYVHPFAKRSALDAAVNFGLPTFAAIISLAALIVAVVKP